MLGMFRNLFDQNSKELKRMEKTLAIVNRLEPEMQVLDDEALRAKTAEFKARLAEGATLEDLLPEAFAVVREAARRTAGKRLFDVQILGGIALHQGRIAEMKTGEGKTLVATLPAYLNALAGQGVHIVTVNDYLAKFHAEWMGPIYRFLGMSVGVILHDMSFAERQAAYRSDITYATNNELGFDYLRDNMAIQPDQLVQRDLHYAIVDEVDSILIDEARTPLIISGQGEQSTDLYHRFAALVARFREEEDYTVDEKAKQVAPTAQAIAKAEQALGVENLYDVANEDLSHYLNQAIRAKALMKLDRDYVVHEGQIVIVDEFTGRLMFGRRYSAGLHQAIEAKEGLKIERESQTLASITFQNYFRMYSKLAGMTGTALTEEDELRHIYGLDVLVIPTNKPMIREDLTDVVYKTEKGKFQAAVEEIVRRHATGQPLLVGTISIEKSEMLSSLLKRRGVPHQVLNAKYHEKEAEIVAQAGRFGAVTISTNMAGRGTDILLGGNPEFLARAEIAKRGIPHEQLVAALDYGEADEEAANVRELYQQVLAEMEQACAVEREQVLAAGGLHVIGTERHESRRIDNQLRGRSGRQGDPGSSQFFISLEDDLMRLFGSDMVAGLMDRLNIEDDMPLEAGMLAKAIEKAQKRVETRNFDIRKHVLQYDDVLNKQREVIYAQRRQVLTGGDMSETVQQMIADVIAQLVDEFAPEKVYPEEWDLAALRQSLSEYVPSAADIDLVKWADLTRTGLLEAIEDFAEQVYAEREAEIGPDILRDVERVVLLRVVDTRWMQHLDAMDELRDGIGLRAYGQKDPLVEYQLESYDMFEQMVNEIKHDVTRFIYHVQVSQPPQARAVARPTRAVAPQPAGEPARSVSAKVGRNDPCPCGSGKKYKRCCGRNNS
ncbi:MAG TPA: preprotein translocase subunit SecA [Firmicutes bacterium]|nr:preprotein translocase subunit SecA [Bacillota bacterium]